MIQNGKSLENINSLTQFSLNFPVVTGGFALLAAIGQTQASAGLLGASALPAIFTPSYLGGAAGLLGNSYSMN